LFFIYSKSLALLKQYFKVLLIDYTYKNNHFHMPLLNILGSTSLNYIFFTIFIFLSSEKKENYLYVLKILQEVINVQKIAFLNIIITNKDKGLINTICYVFPQLHNLLYG
jgi:MULE transposase domain